LRKEIKNHEFLQYQSLLEQYKITRKAKIEYQVELLNKAREELKKKDLTQLPVKDLICLIEKTEKNLNLEMANLVYHTGEFEDNKHFLDLLDPEKPTEIIEKLV